MTRMARRFLALAACAAALAASPALADDYASDWARSSKADARLVAGAPGEAGVEIRLAPGAVTYWRDPGDSGAPPRFDFAGSRNLARAEPAYPAPSRIVEADGSQAFGYQDKVVFPIAVVAADASKPVELALQFDYAVCEKLCIPAKATLKLTLPSTGASPYAATLAAARAEAPHATDLAALGGELTALGAGAWRLCAPAEPGARRDLFIEAPDGWWLTTTLDASAKDRACFAIALQQKPGDASLPVAVHATLTGGATPREFPLTLAPKG
jgi:DsbC/DsbD-like thiol-disulfide interchange protein